MNVISSSYGNDSVALIQWAKESGLENVSVVFIDTGWSAPGWLDRVASLEQWVRGLGFTPAHIKPDIQFEELMRIKKGFPNQRYQWCSAALKGVPFLIWADEVDAERKATVLIGKRREESQERADTPEFIEASEYHGDRRLWHPLYEHTAEMRDALIRRAGFDPLPHRSGECSPCINANRGDLRGLGATEIERVKSLEAQVGNTMFRPKRHGGAKGIEQVIQWAYSKHGQYDSRQESLFNSCSSGYCGY